ncbi:unnamed protein product [Pedinophyceae sp. YPF-701]|nr:unnamed protein product [Pedinophyceae sp. YPF-701]
MSQSGCPALEDVYAVDTERVQVVTGKESHGLAAVSIVDYRGEPVFFSYVRPTKQIVDYRTKFSGIRRDDLVDAPSINAVRRDVRKILGRPDVVIVGHSLQHDLAALFLRVSARRLRDTALYPPLMRVDANRCVHSRKLRHLAADRLGWSIQDGEHDPTEDARAAMKLYMKYRGSWEDSKRRGALRDGSFVAALCRWHPRSRMSSRWTRSIGRLVMGAEGCSRRSASSTIEATFVWRFRRPR